MGNIQQVQEFVKNGGRFRTGKNPVWGEPFYGVCMAQYIQEHFKPGDKVDLSIQYPQSEDSEPKQYKATILRVNKDSIEIIKQGNTVWKDQKNYDSYFYNCIKFISLIKHNQDFSIEKADPTREEWRKNSERERLDRGENPDKYELKYRTELKEVCNKIYPNSNFDDSVVMNLNFSIYFPWQVDKVEAEVYIDHKNNPIKVIGKTGKPYPNKNVIAFYNDKDVVFGPSALVVLPKEDYTGSFVTCKWIITSGDKEHMFISMVELVDFKLVENEKNVYCIGDKMCLIDRFKNKYKSSEYSGYENLMDSAAVFYLNNEGDKMFVVREPESEEDLQLYGFHAMLAINKYNLQTVVESMCSAMDKKGAEWGTEIWVRRCRIEPHFVNNYSYWQYNERYKWSE